MYNTFIQNVMDETQKWKFYSQLYDVNKQSMPLDGKTTCHRRSVMKVSKKVFRKSFSPFLEYILYILKYLISIGLQFCFASIGLMW